MRIVHYHPRAVVGDGRVSSSVRRSPRALSQTGALAAIAYDAADRPPPHDDGVEWIPVRHRGTNQRRRPRDPERALRPGRVRVLNSAWTVHTVRAGALARRVDV